MNVEYSFFCEELKHKFQKGLPGASSQYLMAPVSRPKYYDLEFYMRNAKQSAVMVLFLEINNHPHILLTQRTENVRDHSNQISFPGGKRDESDVNLEATALRELKEEVGLSEENIEVLGALTPLYIPVSNYYVQPFLGINHASYQLNFNVSEVKELIFLPMEKLLDDSLVQNKKLKLDNGQLREVPAFVFEEKILWGATAMILSEVKHILKS